MINIITQLNTLISNSNPSDISFIFASYVKGNLKNIETMSIDEIAQVCNTSSSSISRLVSKMGYSSYKSFRKECNEALAMLRQNRSYRFELAKQYGLSPKTVDSFFTDHLVPTIKQIKQSDVEKMVQWLSKSHLYFFGSLDIHFILEELQASMSGRPNGSPIVLTDLAHANDLKSDDCLLVISIMGNSLNSESIVNRLKKCRANKYLLTTTLNKADTSMFDEVIELGTNERNATVNNYLVRFFLDMVETEFMIRMIK